MQITEMNNDGLKRTLKVTVDQTELGERFNQKIDEIKGRVQLKGFRKGKVPISHIKKLYGRSVMAEVLEQTVRETSSKAITDRNERPAMQPDIDLPKDEGEIEKVISGEAGLAYSMSFEVLPEIAIADLTTLKLEKLVVEVAPEAIDEVVADLAKRSTTYDAEEGRAAQDGDRLMVDFVGKIDGEPFQGGDGKSVEVVMGRGGFIPGFEEGMAGLKAGDEKVLKVTFPEAYQAEHLAGKEAEFDVKVLEVGAPKLPEIDDEFAKTLGAESFDKLKEMIKDQLAQEYQQGARMKIKRELLDELEKVHEFELPASLVDNEFDSIWTQLNDGMKQENKTFADENKTEEEARTEYRKLAERRVRLGLVIGEIGDKNKIQVTQDELRAALVEQARRYPGQEKFVYEYYEKTPGALAQLRAPLFEDKVVDFVLEQAKPAEKTVSKDELMKALDDAAQADA
ncbi:MAG: trigger factor [Hyphomicrobiaceae bacterium]